MRRSTANKGQDGSNQPCGFCQSNGDVHKTLQKNGNAVEMKMACSCEHPENKYVPKYLNKVLGDKNAERVIVDMYQEHIGSGSFGEVADDIIAGYFDNSILTTRQQRGWFGMLPEFLLMWINSHCWFRSIHALLSLVVVRKEKQQLEKIMCVFLFECSAVPIGTRSSPMIQTLGG